MNDALTTLVPALATALLQFLWQGVVLGMLTALALALLRNARPHARYAIACAALLTCVALPVWTVVAAMAGTDASMQAVVTRSANALSTAMSATPGAVLRAVSSPSGETLPWIAALWASGVALLSLRMACGLLWVRRLRRAAEASEASWQACVDRLAPRLGIARPVALRVTLEGATPVTAGWWRPVVLLPLGIATRMPADLIEALIAHELAHVRRHDYLVNLLQGVAEALLFYHPVVWWLSRRIRIERELVADDLAATALGDRRRLALALSELDRHQAPARSNPSPHYAPAAHGGHLMSRIQQLIRPQRRALAGALVLPLLGLAVAGATFYAHAQLAPPAERTAPAVAAKPLPAPTAKPGARIVATAAESRDRSSFALVQGDRDGITMHGSTDDIEDIESARDGIDGDFVWFRRDGKAWVLRDAQTVARVREAWAGTDALSAQMQGLEARMQPHSERMEALGARMEALSADNVMESPEARAALAKMDELGRKAGTLGQRQAALGLRLSTAGQADMARLEAEQAGLEREQDALEREMERYETAIESLNDRMEAQHEPLEALGREMEAAGKPMEAIGREMEALGKRLEREAERADAQVRQLLDDAYRNGRAEPAPVRR